MYSIHGMNGGMPRAGSIGGVAIVESLETHFARCREANISRYQLALMDRDASDQARLAARRQLVLLESDPGPARTDAEHAADEEAKVELRFARRHRSSIYRAQRKVILDWMSTNDQKRGARALLKSMFGKLDDDLMESTEV